MISVTRSWVDNDEGALITYLHVSFYENLIARSKIMLSLWLSSIAISTKNTGLGDFDIQISVSNSANLLSNIRGMTGFITRKCYAEKNNTY